MKYELRIKLNYIFLYKEIMKFILFKYNKKIE